MMEKEFTPYVNQFGMIARSTNPPSWTSGRVGYGQLFDYTNEVNVEDDDSLDWGETRIDLRGAPSTVSWTLDAESGIRLGSVWVVPVLLRSPGAWVAFGEAE